MRSYNKMPVGENKLTPLHELKVTEAIGFVRFFDSPEEGAKIIKRKYKELYPGGSEHCGWNITEPSATLRLFIRDVLIYNFWEDSPLAYNYSPSQIRSFALYEMNEIYKVLTGESVPS